MILWGDTHEVGGRGVVQIMRYRDRMGWWRRFVRRLLWGQA